MTFGSLLILVGSSGRISPPLLIAGGLIALAVCGFSVYSATKHWEDRPRPAIVLWAIAGVVVFYVLVGAGAAAAGLEYGLVGVAAGAIPLSAVCLLLATMRSATAGSEEHLQEDTDEAEKDPLPRLSLDDQTPMGDTPEHSDTLDDPAVSPSGRWEHPAANKPGSSPPGVRR